MFKFKIRYVKSFHFRNKLEKSYRNFTNKNKAVKLSIFSVKVGKCLIKICRIFFTMNDEIFFFFFDYYLIFN